MERYIDETQRSIGNRRNNKGTKAIRASGGTIDIDTARDRRSNFERKLAHCNLSNTNCIFERVHLS